MKYLLLIMLFGIPGLANAKPCTESMPVPPYQAAYELHWGFLYVGNTTMTLTATGNHGYRYESETHPAGVARWIRKDVITEVSRFKWECGHFLPLAYRYSQTGGSYTDSQQIDFDWSTHKAATDDKGRHVQNEIKNGTLDQLLAQLALSTSQMDRTTDTVYPVLNGGEIEVYKFRLMGSEILNTSLGNIETVKLERRNPANGRVLTFWLAPQYHYLPVKMEQVTPRRPSVTLEIERLDFGAH